MNSPHDQYPPEIHQPTTEFPLMTPAEYANTEHAYPYVYEIQSGDKKLTYFGAAHSADPADPMFDQIESRFNEAKPDIVLVEGVNNLEGRLEEVREWLAARTREEIINDTGEPGFTVDLALKRGIEVRSPEPSFQEEIQFLLDKRFSREEIFAFYFARAIPQYQKMPTKPNFEEYIGRFLNGFRAETHWEDFDFSTTHFDEISQRLWALKFDAENANYEDQVDPIPWEHKKAKQGVSNEIARQSNYFRDAYMVQEVQDLMKTHKSMFIVFGGSHAVMQEPALRQVFKD